MTVRRAVLLGALAALTLAVAGCAAGPAGTEAGLTVPRLSVGVESAQGPQDVASGIQILLLLTVLTLAPSLLIMLTSFTRTIIVLSLLRNAIGVPQLPPNQVLIGLSLFLTFFVMAPTWNQINQNAVQPFMAGEIRQAEAFDRAVVPVREFMLRQTREKDLALFVSLAKLDRPRTADDIPTYVIVPSFVISELKTAFQMGFLIFVPFLVIDIVVSSTLMSMGMLMLPPVLISLPFKLLLFVMVDGWHLIVRSLVLSFS
ncbi:MAG TPA: flagellar type III secretion system pore protein FliP [Chloroflexota bacterium]|jgi:flagellar biosynthetic protein FliP|nr:flagellar type III secretion system pore protein FliP [Chloroflexota bacterium]